MSLTADAIKRAAGALADERIPALEDLRELMAAWRRMQAGCDFKSATGAPGSAIALRERNDSLLSYAETLNPVGNAGPWVVAGRLEKALNLRNTPPALVDAVRIGADSLSRQQLYRILVADKGDESMLEGLGQTSIIQS